jgi:hypothetical protein
MNLSMTRAEREAFLAGVHVGVLSIPEPGRGPLSTSVAPSPGEAEERRLSVDYRKAFP